MKNKMKKCMICNGNMIRYKIEGLDICTDCGFITTDMNLSKEDIKRLYTEGYFHGEEYADYTADKKITQRNFEKRVNNIKKFINNPENKSVFEIGCAYGYFLDVARKNFRDVEGIDISDDAVNYAKTKLNLNVTAGDYKEFTIRKKVDLICMWDTIEHLQEPDAYIAHAYNHLKPHGKICITTGDIGSKNAQLRGAKWRQIHPPTHLHYFSADTLAKLLEREGFRVKYVGYPNNLISLNTVLYTIFVLKVKMKFVYKLLDMLQITKINLPFNLHDFMFVVAEKHEKN